MSSGYERYYEDQMMNAYIAESKAEREAQDKAEREAAELKAECDKFSQDYENYMLREMHAY